MTRPAKTLILTTDAARALLAGERVEIRRPCSEPIRVRIPSAVYADWPMLGATPAGVYDARVGRAGSVSVAAWHGVVGTWLGVRPGEFAWVDPPWTAGQVLPAREPWSPAEPGPLNRDILIAYRADYARPVGVLHWCSAASLPGWAVRIYARVVEVRVETAVELYPRREWVATIEREASRE